jgi:hypothetical protein
MPRARSEARLRTPRDLRGVARRMLAASALSLLALLGFGAASALAGPGVLLSQGAGTDPIRITGSQIAGATDSGPTTYTVRERPGGPSSKLTLRGATIRSLLSTVGVDASSVTYVQVVGGDGSVITLRQSEINGGFPEGPAIVTDEGGTTRFFKPVSGAGGTSENVTSVPGTPLEMTVNGGSLLSVKATATPTSVKTGQSVTFTATVQVPPPGAQLTYLWDFGDGTRGIGRTITHQYSISGDIQAQVKVQGSGGSTAQCASVCGGVKAVDVTVTGRERRPDQNQGTPTGTGTSSNFGGTGGTGSGGGSGNGSATGGNGTGAQTAPKPQPKAPPLRAVRPESRSPFSKDPDSGVGKTIIRGVLLASQGKAITGGLPESKAGGSPKPQKGVPGTPAQGGRLAVGLAFAFAMMSIGALQERRRVRLRLA